MAEEMDYASSGVDITLEGEAVGALIGALGKFSRPSGTLGSPVEVPGGFGGLIQFKDDDVRFNGFDLFDKTKIFQDTANFFL